VLPFLIFQPAKDADSKVSGWEMSGTVLGKLRLSAEETGRRNRAAEHDRKGAVNFSNASLFSNSVMVMNKIDFGIEPTMVRVLFFLCVKGICRVNTS